MQKWMSIKEISRNILPLLVEPMIVICVYDTKETLFTNGYIFY